MPERIIELGIMLLLICTPLALGGVTPRAIAFLEISSGLLVLLWLLNLFFARQRPAPSHRRPQSERKPFRPESAAKVLRKLPFLGIMGAFFTLLGLQLIPLPGFLVNLISPATYRLYAEGATATATTLPAWLSLSVCPQATAAELAKLLAYAAVFFLILTTVRTSKQVNRLILVILFMGFFEALYGLLQFVSGQYRIYSYQTGSPWVQGTFWNKNHCAGYLEMVILLAFGMLFTRFEKRGSASSGKDETFEEKYMKRGFVLFVLFLLLSAQVLTGSRGGLISFTGGMLGFALLVYLRHLLRSWIILLVIFLPLTLGSIVLTNSDVILKRVSTLKDVETDSSFQVRLELWRSAVRIFQEYPLIGSGLGTFAHLSQRYRTFRWNLQFNYPENDYVQLLAETGISGAGLICWLGGLFFYRILTSWKQRRSRWAIAVVAGGLSALFSLLIHSSTDFNLHIPSNALLFTVIAALTYVTVQIHRADSRKHANVAPDRAQKVEKRREHVKVGGRFQSSRRWIGIPAVVLVCGYIFWVADANYGFGYYDAVSPVLSQQKFTPLDAAQQAEVVSDLETAIRHDRRNAEYAYALGKYLARYYTDVQNAETLPEKKSGFQAAESWLKKAVLLDPANPWQYYELGLLRYQRGDCQNWQQTHPAENWEKCPVTQYFLAAWRNAPKNTFLRKAVSQWYYAADPQAAAQFVRRMLAGDAENTLVSADVANESAKFLYDLRLDYESDWEAKRALPRGNNDSARCSVNVIRQDSPPAEIELGNDDGSAEWRTPLTSETSRVKKVLCLPENLAAYQHAALKIYLSTVGNKRFTAQISIDDRLVPQIHFTGASGPAWHEIPFATSLLTGKTQITVYIRVLGASETGSYLEIWGDQDTVNTQSTFNLAAKNDLSSEKGVQTGEYMIRLVLKKP